MTAFMLSDELERDFEPLEEHPARHAAAVAMYCLTGQKCAQRTTDGKIPTQVIIKTFAAWPASMRSAAIADLVAIGKWTESDEGELLFVDWDLLQYTREQELNRRAKQAAKQRARRQRRKVESGDVPPATPPVTYLGTKPGDVPRDVAVPSASASASVSLRDPEPVPLGGPTLDQRERAMADAGQFVRVEFARRFEQAERSLWTRQGDPAVELLAAWALSVPGDPKAAVTRLLDGFFADGWARSRHFDVQHLAKYPQKYFEPRAAPRASKRVDPAERLAELRAQFSVLEGDLATTHDADKQLRIKTEMAGLRAEMRDLKAKGGN